MESTMKKVGAARSNKYQQSNQQENADNSPYIGLRARRYSGHNEKLYDRKGI
jgi:hypothetical protein